jgi:hypothetical protein
VSGVHGSSQRVVAGLSEPLAPENVLADAVWLGAPLKCGHLRGPRLIARQDHAQRTPSGDIVRLEFAWCIAKNGCGRLLVAIAPDGVSLDDLEFLTWQGWTHGLHGPGPEPDQPT